MSTSAKASRGRGRMGTWIAAVLVGSVLAAQAPAPACGGEATPDTLAPIARAVLPSIVSVTGATDADSERPSVDRMVGDVFRDLFGDDAATGRQPVAAGVILDASGLVLTSAHAVVGVEGLEAVTADGIRHGVTLVGSDRKTGVAVIRLAGPGPFAPATFADSDAVHVGDLVLAFGSPYGLGPTVTAGIVGATPRPRPTGAIDELFQTDAATFPAGAGGALVNGRGEVIGLATMLTSDPFGITFAMPANRARKVAAELVRSGEVARGAIDARLQPVTPGLARALRLPEAVGVVITEVAPRGAAANGGLRPGDVVTRLFGQRVETPYDIDRVLRDSAPGQTMELDYWRQGQRYVSRMTLAREADSLLARPFAGRAAALLRAEVRALTPEMGVVVSHVRPDGGASQAGLRAGDIIREVNQQPVRTMGDFQRLVDGVKPGDWLAFLVQRGRVPVYVAVEARRTDVSALPATR